MKKLILFLVLIVSILSLFTSCQIERKRYSNGFSVFSVGILENSNLSDLKDNEKTKVEHVIEAEYSTKESDDNYSNERSITKDKSSIKKENSNHVAKTRAKTYCRKRKIPVDKERCSDDPVKKNEPLSLLSFLLVLSLAPLLFLQNFGSVFFLLFLLFIPASVVLGILGIIKIDKNPDKYKNKWMAILGLVLGSISLIITVYGIIMIIVIFY
ncbi:MAG: DUF4190 domain-containing protein [Bacteroidales bacterium]|nr:DUF4190 domain-containing protein [Bacteroidales bacterium]